MTCNLPQQPVISQTQILEVITTVCETAAVVHDLDALMQPVIHRLRHLLDTDRVVVYRFLPSDDGVIAAESVGLGWLPLQGELIYDPCFGGTWGDRYRQGQVGVVTDVEQSDIEPCYRELLSRLQVRANLVVPVFSGPSLWGLLIAHQCCGPREWNPSSRNLLEHVARQLGQGIYQIELRLKLKAAQEQIAKRSPLDQSERLFQLLTDHVEQILFIRDAVSRQFLYVSSAYDRIWQQPRSALYNDPDAWLNQIHPDDLTQVETSVNQQFAGQSGQREYRIVRPSGEVRWIQARVRSVEGDPNQPRYVVGWAEDCTDSKRLQAHLQATEATLNRRVSQEQLLRTLTARMRESLDLATILRATVAGIKTVFKADRAVIFQFLPDGSRRIVEQATHPDYPTITNGMIPPEPLPAVYLDRLRTGHPLIINDMATAPWSAEVAVFLDSIEVKAAMIAPIIHPAGGDRQGVWGILVVHTCGDRRQWQPFEANMLQHFGDQLTTALHQAELYRQLQAANQELDRLAKVDSLTQLANRRWLDAYLYQEWQRLARQQQPLSVILADVDFFKLYNDTYGHAAGDQCLIAIADSIRAGVRRPADLAARYGGEEFALVLPDTDETGAIHVVEMVRHHLQDLALPHGASPNRKFVSLSFGIATMLPILDAPADSILAAADQALYASKATGRNQYQIFSCDP